MSRAATMPGPDGRDVKAWRRYARNVRAGDWLPEHGAHVVADALTDPVTGRHWLTLEDGTDVECTPRRRVWLYRRYEAPADVVEAWRSAFEAWRAAFEAATHTTYVDGAQLARERRLERRGGRREVTDYLEAHPVPRLSMFMSDYYAAARSHNERMTA